jgi:hypothetical protein
MQMSTQQWFQMLYMNDFPEDGREQDETCRK